MLDLLTFAGIPTAVGASEAVHQQRLLDEEAEAPERQEPFYIDVYCDAQSKKKDEVHDAIVVLKDGKVPSATGSPSNAMPCPILIKDAYSSASGLRTPKPSSPKRTLTRARRRIPSAASSTPSLRRTCRIALFPLLPSSASSAPFPRRQHSRQNRGKTRAQSRNSIGYTRITRRESCATARAQMLVITPSDRGIGQTTNRD
jgi:hypothetical protein